MEDVRTIIDTAQRADGAGLRVELAGDAVKVRRMAAAALPRASACSPRW